MADTVPSSGWRGKLAGFALAWAVFSIVWFALAGLGSRFGLWSWQFGLGQMVGNVNAGYGRYIVYLSALLAVVALIVAVIKSPRVRPTMLSIAAILITLFVGGRWLGFQLTALSLPPIHQAATDWEDPVPFSSNLMTVREEAGALNAVEPSPVVQLPEGARERWPGFHGKTVAQVQEDAEMDPALRGKDADEKAYPPMDTVTTSLTKDEAFDVAMSLVERRGWDVVGANHGDGRIEATHTSTWFGFKDDVALRIRSLDGGGAEIDMRSVSRVGLSDLGANSRRVANFMYDLDRLLGQAEREAG
ncbi:MAG: DUF1499 domain-containing protein [Pseudomonadota bacterium]